MRTSSVGHDATPHVAAALATAEALLQLRRASSRTKGADLSALPPRGIWRLKQSLDEERISYGEVYAPNDVDTHGDFMTVPEIRKLGHRFLMEGRVRNIDVQHDKRDGQGVVVESWLEREHPSIDAIFAAVGLTGAEAEQARPALERLLKAALPFTPGSWVLGVKWPDGPVWAAIKAREITGFSMEVLADAIDLEVLVEEPRVIRGLTDPGGTDRHVHEFVALVNEADDVIDGETTVAGAHFHAISEDGRTAIAADHRHTFSRTLDIVVSTEAQ